VTIGIVVFSESLTLRLAVGIVTILIAVFFVVMGKNLHLKSPFHLHPMHQGVKG